MKRIDWGMVGTFMVAGVGVWVITGILSGVQRRVDMAQVNRMAQK